MKKFTEINWLDDACNEYGISFETINNALALYVQVENLPEHLENYPDVYDVACAREKIYEADEIEVQIRKETRKPADRAVRRKATAKAKRHLTEIEPFTYSVRRTRNGACIRKGDTYSWLPEWKRMNVRLVRHEGKRLAREFME